MKVKKVINNNVVCAIDKSGNELIVTGCGIGFKKKVGQLIDETLITQTYRMEDKKSQRKLRELAESIDLEALEVTERMIEMIKGQLSAKLSENLLITLADHVNFAVKRKKQGIEFSNPLEGAIMSYYPTEYHLGQKCLMMVEEAFGIRLNRAEASFIALHIVNAELNTHMSQIYEITKLIEGSVEVVENYYQYQFDRDSLGFSRFIVHLRYFAQRLFQNQLLRDESKDADVSFLDMIAKSCPEHFTCAEKLGAVYGAHRPSFRFRTSNFRIQQPDANIIPRCS
ncbi:MAG: PRD domain-containing protein [Lachnospiraceae bacterium]|nr:PRD domain-containing protein [Lachnospiraceae bacterium]